MRSVKKRDGNVVVFDKNRIVEAIYKAATSVGGSDRELAEALAEEVITTCEKEKDIPSVELIQDTIEKILIKHGHAKTAKAFILYRAEKERLRAGSVAPPKIDPEDPLLDMFEHQSKLRTLIPDRYVKAYQRLYFTLQRKIAEGSLPTHPDNDYVGGNELARDIFEKKYYVRNLKNDPVETRPEHVFKRLAAFLGSLEESPLRQDEAAERYYKMMYQGYFMPGGRVIAGAGDLYRVKTLANCFVTQIEGDNIESIYNAAYDCARTYSYGGGIGVDISSLRPKDAVVHNAANKSTGAVSFMELFSLTTGLIGQSGRRGALMLTLDVKHPDIYRFINVKKVPNWVTNQIVEQCKWSNTFSEEQLREIEKQVMENTQVRFANISIKTNDEFMQAVEEQTKYGPEMILIYEKEKKPYPETAQSKENHYSFGIPSKDILDYRLIKKCGTIAELKRYLNEEYEISLPESALDSTSQRDVFGDYVIERDDIDLAIRRAGDFLLYFNSKQTGEIKRLVKARDVWNQFIAGNYKTAEPGIIFWSTMKAYSPSNYVGRPILSTNPCGEVPLEDGGACNLGSLNLSRFVVNGYKETAEIDWKLLKEASYDAVRFLDSVVQWNELLNPLEKQKKAARETRRTGLGVMGIADMLNQLGMGYDSDEAIRIVEKIMRTIANHAYRASANLAVEKGPSPLFTYDAYSKNKFFIEALDEETKEIIKEPAKGVIHSKRRFLVKGRTKIISSRAAAFNLSDMLCADRNYGLAGARGHANYCILHIIPFKRRQGQALRRYILTLRSLEHIQPVCKGRADDQACQ